MREPGELSVTEAAQRLGIHRDTVCRWVQTTLYGGPGRRFQNARKDIAGRYWLRENEVVYLLEQQRLGYT